MARNSNEPIIRKRGTTPLHKGKTALNFVLRAVIVLSVLLLLMYFIALLSGFKPYFDTTASSKALLFQEQERNNTDKLLEKHVNNLQAVAEKLSFAENKDRVDKLLSAYIGSEQFGNLHYFCKGQEYSTSGTPVKGDANSEAARLASTNKAGVTDVYFNSFAGMDCIAIYFPVKGSQAIDGLLSILPARNIIDLNGARAESTAAAALVTKDAKVLCYSLEDGFPVKMETNFVDFTKTLAQDKEIANQVQAMIKSPVSQSCQMLAQGQAYTVTCASLASTDHHLRLVTVTLSTLLTDSEMTYIRQIIVVSVISILALLIALGFAFLFHTRVKRMLLRNAQITPELGCANAGQFRRKSNEIIAASDSAGWYVICAEVRQFSYISEQFGHDIILQQLKYIAKILDSVCTGREFFGYAEDGVFQILLHCKDEAAFHNRIQLITSLVGKSTLLKEHGIVNGLYFGAYGVGGVRNLSIGQILEYASSARTMAKSDVQKPYVLYTDDIRDELMRNEQIEAQMEDSLENGEFKLFLQPKYNAHKDCLDSAEALVRWFDPRRNDYIFPVEFIPLFESNGFVTKLDHFMYLEVCKYFQNAAQRGDKMVPIAVNVSRVTAMRPDFLEFYIGNKEKYGIADHFLTVEMTESFAMQNYEAMKLLVDELHAHGIRVSIDDFGSGYSSFEVLKKVPVDELKMDRVFIIDGLDAPKDLMLEKTVIQMAKAMGMSVVQEGVETKDLFDLICSLGCDVIQGYYYARAIPLEEYRIFVRSNTSIRYKAQVK